MSRRHDDALFSGPQLGVNKPLQIKINTRHCPARPSQPHPKTSQTDGRHQKKRGCRWILNLTNFHDSNVSSGSGMGQPIGVSERFAQTPEPAEAEMDQKRLGMLLG
jgi:hypothetical protein